MCDWEEFIFSCGCSVTKLKNYCHFARNHPTHGCNRVQVLKKVWDLPEMCDKCRARHRAAAQAQAQQGGSSGSSQSQRHGGSSSRR